MYTFATKFLHFIFYTSIQTNYLSLHSFLQLSTSYLLLSNAITLHYFTLPYDIVPYDLYRMQPCPLRSPGSNLLLTLHLSSRLKKKSQSQKVISLRKIFFLQIDLLSCRVAYFTLIIYIFYILQLSFSVIICHILFYFSFYFSFLFFLMKYYNCF